MEERVNTKSRLLTTLSQGKRLSKILWEKEKMLVTSIFSFSRNVFYHITDKDNLVSCIEDVVCNFFQFGPVQNLSFGKELKSK